MIKLHIKQGNYYQDANLFKDATLPIKTNNIYIIKGNNGSGKTTLLNLLLGLTNKGFYCDFTFEYESVKLINKIHDNFIKDSAFLFQNVTELLNPLYRVSKQIHIKDIKQQLISLFELRDFNKYPNQYSNGELNKILLSLILSQNKSYIILDEPTTNLDYKSMEKLAEYLLNIGKTLVITTHNNDFISLLTKKQPNLSILEIDNMQLNKIDGNNIVNVIKKQDFKNNANAIISLQNYHISIDKKPIISNLSWQIYKDQINIITGNNGIGKTTLALSIYHKLINYKKNSYYTSNKGIIFHNDTSKNVSDVSRNNNNVSRNNQDVSWNVSYVSQNYYQNMDLNFSVLNLAQDILQSNFDNLSKFAKNKIMLNKLKILGLSKDILSKKLNTLSGGYRQKISLYFALLIKPKILILDEITSSMDNNSNQEMIDILQKLATQDKITIILITHNNKLINHFNNNIINIDNKNISNII
jgi:ABC-type multidrug transport system ATPase subunit